MVDGLSAFAGSQRNRKTRRTVMLSCNHLDRQQGICTNNQWSDSSTSG